MVDGRAAELDAETDPVPGPNWLAWRRRPKPLPTTGLEHCPALLGRERAGLAEGVDPSGVRGAPASISPHTSST